MSYFSVDTGTLYKNNEYQRYDWKIGRGKNSEEKSEISSKV